VVLAAPQQLNKLSCRLDEHHQEKQLTFDTQRTHSSFTAPHIIQQTNQGIESLEAEEGGKVDQKLTRRRRQAGVEPGGEGQARSKPQLTSKQ
jgi:hypothetical protein